MSTSGVRGSITARLRLLLALLPCVALASCRSDDAETFEDVRRTVRSWSATIAMTARQWNEAQVPSLYVRQTVDAARESLGQQDKKLSQATDAARRDALRQEIVRLERRMDELSGAVGRDDRPAAASVADALRVDLNLTSPPPDSGSEGGEAS